MADRITVKMDPNAKGFTPCPTGLQHAVCVDVVDMGQTVEQYKDQPAHLVQKAVLVFQTDEVNPDTGKRFEPSIEFTVATEYNAGEGLVPTFGPKSKLRKMLGNWRGKEYSDDEAKEKGAPLDKLVGVNAFLNIMHKVAKSSGNTYAVIEAINPPPKKAEKLAPRDYQRSAHWAKKKGEYAEKAAAYRSTIPANDLEPQGYDEMPAALQDDDDELPF